MVELLKHKTNNKYKEEASRGIIKENCKIKSLIISLLTKETV